MRRFNDTMGDLENVGPAELIKRRAELLAEVFVFDESSAPEIEPPMAFDYGFNVHFGKKFFANYNCTFLDVAIITIGNNVMLGPNVCLYIYIVTFKSFIQKINILMVSFQVQLCTATHPLDFKARNSGIEFGLPINVCVSPVIETSYN